MAENTFPPKLLAQRICTAVLVFTTWRAVPGYIAAQVAGATLGVWAIVSAEIFAGIAAGFVYLALNARRTTPKTSSVTVPSEGVPA